jgi:isopentenyldiphosphate isomerase
MADYYIDIVNNDDEVIGTELKSKKRGLGFISRVVAIIIRDSTYQYLICKRSAHKADVPDKWDLAAAGNVEVGETYENAAKRELSEELGFTCDLNLLDKYYQEFDDKGTTLKFFVAIYLGISNEIPELNDELAECKKQTFDDLDKNIRAHPESFCPGFVNDWQRVKDKLKFEN